MKTLKTFLLCVLLTSALFAQEKSHDKKWNIEIGASLYAFGPELEMADLMTEYGFDKPTSGWFSNRQIEHPNYDKVNLSYQISYSRYITNRSQFGLQFNHAFLNEVSGYSAEAGYLFINFTSLSFTPIYAYELKEVGELRLGPSLMINRAKRTSSGNLEKEDYKKISAGFLAEGRLDLWSGHVSSGKLIVGYLYTSPVEIGPFTSRNYNKTVVIPKNKIGFGYFKIGIVCGFHPYQLD